MEIILTVKGLSTTLYTSCNSIFLQCDQFDHYDRLRSFCRGHEELHSLTFILKSANNQQELYELNLPLLVETNHGTYGWIFPHFLKALKEVYKEGDDRRVKLDLLLVEVQGLRNQQQPQLYQSKKSDVERKLFKLLLRINFSDQENIFKNALESEGYYYKKTAAFLIHGEEQFGQETLVTRLSRLPQLRNGRQIKVKASEMKDIFNLWNEIAKSFSIQSTSLLREKVVEAINECLETQNLIIIISEVDRTYLGFLSELIQEFWQLIINKRKHKNDSETYLIMFLVDNKGNVCSKSGISLAWQLSQPEYPEIPLHLPPISRFPQDKLQEWLSMAQAAEVVPENLCVKTLIRESQGGVPELIYQKICQSCNTSWEGNLAQWLIQ
jgi:inactive STAND